MEKQNLNQTCNTQVFWGEMSPCDHVLQIYKTDDAFLDVLEEFTLSGIASNECVIIIGTVNHLKALEDRMLLRGLDVDALNDDEQFIPLNAEIALGKFMRNNKPDERLFSHFVMGLMDKANRKKRKVRAFGEMVAILWAEGHNEATVQLENLWTNFCNTEAFCLFCAYPENGFTQDITSSIKTICQAHTKVIDRWNKSETEVVYKSAS